MHLIPNRKRTKQASWRAYKRWWRKQQYTEVWFTTDKACFPFGRIVIDDEPNWKMSVINDPHKWYSHIFS